MGARSCGSNTLLAYHFRVLAPALCLALRHPPLLFLTHSCCAVALLHSGRSGGQASEKDFECSPRVRLSSRRVTGDRPSGSVQLVVPASPALPRRSRHGLPGMACPCAGHALVARTHVRPRTRPPTRTHARTVVVVTICQCLPSARDWVRPCGRGREARGSGRPCRVRPPLRAGCVECAVCEKKMRSLNDCRWTVAFIINTKNVSLDLSFQNTNMARAHHA